MTCMLSADVFVGQARSVAAARVAAAGWLRLGRQAGDAVCRDMDATVVGGACVGDG